MTDAPTRDGLGKTCPRCGAFTLIFPGVKQAAAHLLPVTGKFKYRCKECGATLDCDTRFLEASPDLAQD